MKKRNVFILLLSTTMKPYLVILIMIIINSSCRKEEYHELDSEFKSYFGIFKDGSWWVLKDTSANTVDSMYITDYHQKREGVSKRSKDWYELVDYKLHSNGKISWAFLGKNTSTGGFTENSNGFGYHNIDLNTDYFYNFPGIYKENNFFTTGENTGLLILSSYNINSYSFYDVIKVWNQTDTFYYAKNVGLIQYKNTNNNYLLTDYHINF